MINIQRFIIIASAITIVSGCSKDFLEVDPQGQLTEIQALSDPGAAEKLVGGTYNTLYFGGFGNTTVGFLFTIATDIASDDSDKGSSPTDFAPAGEIDNFTITPDNSIFNNLWNGHYAAIARVNRSIDILTQSTFDESVKNRLLGEVRFLRGLYYFNLVRLFGGVPKVIRVPDPAEGNNDEFQTRASTDEIYQVIIEDFQFAADNLPLKGAIPVGRATKGAAQSFLSKVFLYRKDYQKAYDLSKEVINSGQYSLVSDYSLIFREKPVNGIGGNNNSESIFEVQTGINVGENAVSQLFSNGQGPRGRGGWNDLGFGFNSPTLDLVNAYEAGDVRPASTIIFINPNRAGTVLWDGFRIPSRDSVENDRYNYKAYHSPLQESPQLTNNKDTKPKNIRLMRYAEVLLINAEAAANIGSTDATTRLNEVRARANLPASVGTVENIWKERRVELALERDRFFDLVRTGRAAAVLTAHGKSFAAGKNELFPIPQAQIDLSGNRLKQNPGY